MADVLAVQDFQCFQNLPGDLAGLRFCSFMIAHTPTQISVLYILHRQEDIAIGFVPAKELDEQVFMLAILGQLLVSWTSSRNTHVCKHDHHQQLLRELCRIQTVSLQPLDRP